MEFNRDTLFMHTPASWWHDLWRDGLVSGNGFIGADVYGGVKDETVMLTHHKLWHNGKEAALPDVSDAFRRLRELMDEERFQEASWTVVNALKEQNYQTQLRKQQPLLEAQSEYHYGCPEDIRAIKDLERGRLQFRLLGQGKH